MCLSVSYVSHYFFSLTGATFAMRGFSSSPGIRDETLCPSCAQVSRFWPIYSVLEPQKTRNLRVINTPNECDSHPGHQSRNHVMSGNPTDQDLAVISVREERGVGSLDYLRLVRAGEGRETRLCVTLGLPQRWNRRQPWG
jgi:hypothetical protein